MKLQHSKSWIGLFVAAVICAPAALHAAPATQPSADEVINKYIEVTGGRAAYEKITTRVVHASLSLPAQGLKGTIEVYSKNPDLLYVFVEIPGTEKKEDGYDGKVGWEKSAMQGIRILKGDELEQLKQQSEASADLDWKKHYKSAVNDGIVDVDGASCYKLTMVNNLGKNETRFYDTTSGLMVSSEADAEAMGTKIHSVTKLSDYRDAGGIKVPFKSLVTINLQGMQIEQSVILDKVETNVEIPASKFDIPDDVKELLKAKPEKDGDKDADKDAGADKKPGK